MMRQQNSVASRSQHLSRKSTPSRATRRRAIGWPHKRAYIRAQNRPHSPRTGFKFVRGLPAEMDRGPLVHTYYTLGSYFGTNFAFFASAMFDEEAACLRQSQR